MEYDIYKQLKAIYDGCDTMTDAMLFCNKYVVKYPNLKSMIISYTNGRTYPDTVDIKTKQTNIENLFFSNTLANTTSILLQARDNSNDIIYKTTLERIACKKIYDPSTENVNKHLKINHKNVVYVDKKCPHCSHTLNMSENTNYIICGYHSTISGYDWLGCGHDWCFSCEKKLCKRWEIDNLCLPANRFHDDECCLNHSMINDFNYMNDYCHCNNNNINR